MRPKVIVFLAAILLTAGGCAVVPKGPSVSALPGSGKTFEQFQADDATCRQWADQRIGQSPQETINQNTAAGAAVGTAAGAVLGAIIGSTSGHAGTGAAVGAGTGLLVGTASGASAGQAYGMEAQRRYDIAYEQCMVAKGNQIPAVQQSPPAPVAESVPPPPPPPPPAPVAEAAPPPPPPAPVVAYPAPPVVFRAPPRFIYSPALGFYVAVETPHDIVFLDGRYYLWRGGFWYTAHYYNGPWAVLRAGRVPPPLHRFGHEEIRRHRDIEYHAYLHDQKHYHARWYVPKERREHH